MGRVMGAVLVAAFVLGGCATQPLPSASFSALPETHIIASVPAGFISFCLRFTDQCKTAQNQTAIITLNNQTWHTLTDINRETNDDIWPEDDLKHYGRAEYWTIPTDGLGDCDDYAVTKRKNLLSAGFPENALRLAVVYSERSGRHAVLTVATDKGDFVLDNRASDVLPWNATNYTWIERQDASNPLQWVSLQTPIIAQPGEIITAAVSPAPGLRPAPGFRPASAVAARAEPTANTVLNGETISAPTP
jgi:predicted transglutaminase-like cysteine proteinase